MTSPTAGVISTVFVAWSIFVTFAVMMRERFRWLRWSTTAWRGSMAPPTTSGRNGWYVRYESGSTTTISASLAESCFSSFHAV